MYLWNNYQVTYNRKMFFSYRNQSTDFHCNILQINWLVSMSVTFAWHGLIATCLIVSSNWEIDFSTFTTWQHSEAVCSEHPRWDRFRILVGLSSSIQLSKNWPLKQRYPLYSSLWYPYYPAIFIRTLNIFHTVFHSLYRWFWNYMG